MTDLEFYYDAATEYYGMGCKFLKRAITWIRISKRPIMGKLLGNYASKQAENLLAAANKMFDLYIIAIKKSEEVRVK